ncbi:LLM class flavin-dependent oxidoreductase [Paractinoplanes rhizophilus]|uniref:LLM class flavin-dependent oxidoreductase n=1 Tax=Paractinoplanes rhizophilus TaxID=1416877 RepID=A0ABW2HVV6_9ACTN
MRSGLGYGAHLPLIDFDGHGWRPDSVTSYARAARRLGYGSLAVNDHIVFQRPWLDGIVALASVVEHSGDMQLVTTVALPVVRGPAVLAKTAAALDVLSGGRLVLGVGPGSSPRDYALAGLRFDERWARFDEAVPVLRAYLNGAAAPSAEVLRPLPGRAPGPQIWIASWGSDAGLARVARLGDGWLASGYNATPARVAGARAKLAAALARDGRRLDDFPCAVATLWTYVTEDRHAAATHLNGLAEMLARPVDQLANRVLIGGAEQCAALLRAYADAGIDRVFIWPVADAEDQLARFMRDVVPLV